MPELITGCPSCHVTFPVTSAQLQAAQGKVRCGLCRQVFNAREYAIETTKTGSSIFEEDDYLIYDNMQIPEELSTALPANKTNQRHQETTAVNAKRNETSKAAQERLPLPDIPSFEIPAEKSPTKGSAKNTWLWGALLILASTFLLAQYVHFHASGIARNPPFKPWVERVCSISGCEIELKNTDLVLTSDLVVQSHPDVEGALKISLVLKNVALYRQPFPNLRLSFEDMDGNTMAFRQFLPIDYLQNQLAGNQLMAINRSVYIELDIIEPKGEVQSYTLTLN